MMVIWLGLMPRWRKIRGSTPWPIEPKPIMTMRPLKSRCFFHAIFFAISVFRLFDSGVDKRRRGLSQGPVATPRCQKSLNADRLERREAVEGDRRIGRRVGAGREDLDLVAGLERQRQLVLGLFVENVGRVAGRTRQHHRTHAR